MNITLKPKDNNSNNAGSGGEVKNKGSLSEFAFFIAINIIVVPISAYQTYIGYKVDVASNIIVAIGIAAFSAILFAAMNFGIRERRLTGKPHGLQVLMYIIPLGISFAGNFNAFYTEQMKKSLYENEVAEYQLIFEKTKNDAINALEDYSGVKEFEKKYGELYQSLQTEANLLDGFGPQCGEIYDSLWVLCGSPNYSKHPLDYSESKRLAMANSLLEPMKSQQLKLLGKETSEKIEDFNKWYDELNAQIEISENEKSLQEDGKLLIDKMRKLNNKIGSETQGMVASFSYDESGVSEKNEMGTVKYAFNSGFIDMPDKAATVFSVFLSLILDILFFSMKELLHVALLPVYMTTPMPSLNTYQEVDFLSSTQTTQSDFLFQHSLGSLLLLYS